MWIAAKLCQPSGLTAHVSRPKIEQRLDHAANAKVVLFRAPTGYGKTCALTHWLKSKKNIGWFNIGPQDNAPQQFANYFLAALQQAIDYQLAPQSDIEPFDLTSAFSHAFAQIDTLKKPCYLVLEDFHHIQDKSILDALRDFIPLLPPNLVLVMTSRTQPNIGLGKLRVRGLLLEFTPTELAFTQQETECFLEQKMTRRLSQQQMAQIHHQIDGWPAALELFALQLSAAQEEDLFAPEQVTPELNTQAVWQYLIEEIFRDLDHNTQSFLLQCAVLERFNPTLAREVTQHVDSYQMLETLLNHGLFIESVPSQNNWYRFQRLFAQFLNHERTLRQPQLESTLNQRAAKGWLKIGNDQLALHHAREAKDHLLTKEIIHQYGWQWLNKGEVIQLQQALSALPCIMIERDFSLRLLHAWVMCELGDHQKLTEQLDAISEQELSLHQHSELLTLKAKIALEHNPQIALDLAQQALSQLGTDAYYNRIVATSVIAQANFQLGHLQRALPLTQQSEKLARQYQTSDYVIWAVLQQSQIVLAQGYPQAAFDLQEKALNLLQPEQLDWQARITVQRAELLLSWGKVSESKALILKLIKPHAELSEHIQLQCYALLIRMALITHNLSKARRYYGELDAKLTLVNIDDGQRASIDLALLLYWRTSQDDESIRFWLNHAQAPSRNHNQVTQLQSRNIARAQFYLSLNSQAADTLHQLQQQAFQHQLITDQIKNTVLQALVSRQNGNLALLDSLNAVNQSGLFGEYLHDFDAFAPMFRSSSLQAQLDQLTRHRVEQLLQVNAHVKRNHQIHFDQPFVTRLLNQQALPQAVLNSPLTQREWQVLGLIYAGMSNDQIAQQFDVAGTTIKTHIRNLYQKLNITTRKQAVATAETLVKLAEYE